MSSTETAPDLRAATAELRAAGCVFAEEEARLLAADPRPLAGLVRRRVAGAPLEHILGWASFCGLRVEVGRGVFVPRRRTEFLVRQAAGLGRRALSRRRAEPPLVVVDLCCGSGAVGSALVAALGTQSVELHAADIDPVSVACARRNLRGVGSVHQGDLFDALPEAVRGRVSLLVANVPYVPAAAVPLLPPEARRHEPRSAYWGGVDGLDVVRRVARGAGGWLRPGGWVLVESGVDQVPGAVAALQDNGLPARSAHSASLDATVVIGRRDRTPRARSAAGWPDPAGPVPADPHA